MMMTDYFNLGMITETPIAFYLLQCKRAKAVEVLVRHFDVEFYYFLRRARGKKVTFFFRDFASSRAWMRRAQFSVAVTEDLINSFINRIANDIYLEHYLKTFDDETN